MDPVTEFAQAETAAGEENAGASERSHYEMHAARHQAMKREPAKTVVVESGGYASGAS